MRDELQSMAVEGDDVASVESKRVDSRLAAPARWLRMLAAEMHWSFVFGVVVTYGVSQGLGGSMYRVATKYYMKDVQKVQPSQSQFYWGITSIPWIVKPLWGLLTDVLPIAGYRRRPYFVLSGFLGIFSMLVLSFYKVHIFLALVLLMAVSASAAIADVTIDACVAQNSISHPSLASDMQSLCAFSSSTGSLLGFVVSGILVHLIGPMGLFGLLSIFSGLPLILGFILDEPHMPDFDYKKVNQKFLDAGKAIWATLQCGAVWRPSLYMYFSLALSLDISEGMFYWYTDAKGGPSFSQETVGFLFSIGSVGSLLGAVLYQHALKNHPFRNLCLWTQLLFGLSGMLDLVLVLRLNLRYGMPDYVFAVVDEGVSQMIGRLKWMPLLVLSSKLCPSGIEGTFFALLMSIDNAGLLSSSWLGGVLLHVLKVTRTEFGNLWLAILVRNILRISPLCLLFLIPGGDPNSSVLPTSKMMNSEDGNETLEGENLELVALVPKGHDNKT